MFGYNNGFNNNTNNSNGWIWIILIIFIIFLFIGGNNSGNNQINGCF